MKRIVIHLLVSTLFFLQTIAGVGQNSPLNSGKWYKLGVLNEGVYQLTVTDFTSMGFSTSELKASNIKIYSNGGAMLPEVITNRPLGLQEISIEVVDENNNDILDGNDVVRFYGEGPHKWILTNGNYSHTNNNYTNSSNYLVTVAATAGKRISTETTTLPATISLSKADYLWFHDSDMVNPLHMGRIWGGQTIGLNNNIFNYTQLLPSSISDTIFMNINILGASNLAASKMDVKANGSITRINLEALDKERVEFVPVLVSREIDVKNKRFDMSLDLIKANNQSLAYLDYIELKGEFSLANISGTHLLRTSKSNSYDVTEFVIESAKSSQRFWNVADMGNIKALTKVLQGSATKVKVENNKSEVKIVLFENTNIKRPIFFGTIGNQNLSSEEVKTMVVIYPEYYKEAAQELVDYKNSRGISAKMVEKQAIYNEFSYAQQDIIGLRDYLRNENLKTGPNGEKMKYVLLLGSASYDPKDRIENNINHIPAFLHPSISKTSSFITDDYLAYTQMGRGIPGTPGYNLMSYAVGRIPARNLQEAKTFVQKLKKYQSPSSFGPWRTQIAFVADDVDNPFFEKDFHYDSEFASSQMDTKHPEFDIKKLYMDAYKQQSTGNREEYPEVKRDINYYMQNGCLFMNYIGHGGERGLAQESIVDIPSINSWRQPNGNYPIFFTATCEFSRFDDPSIQSGGELSLFNPEGGTIALLTTTRLVYVDGNSVINRSFWGDYGFPKNTDDDKSLGALYQTLKNRPTTTSEDFKFSLLGDPSMEPNFPKNTILLDSINGTYILSSNDTFKAFSVVTIKGHVADRNANKLSLFNGELWSTIYDKVNTLNTLGNDGNGTLPYKLRNSIVYKGKVDVTNGDFTIKFVVPKDIAYNVGKGRIYMYAHNKVTDASGSYDPNIGSSVDPGKIDTVGPVVVPFMNDFTFKKYDIVNKNSSIVAKINDLSGVNSTGNGIGRNIVAIIDEGTDNEVSYDLNSYFVYEKNSYTSGSLNFPVEDLPIGKHVLKIKAWDIFNNLGVGETEFEVVDDKKLIVEENAAFPNPFYNGVNIKFQHNFAGQDLEATILIFSTAGTLVAQKDQTLKNTMHVDDQLFWDGYTSTRSPVAPGIYIYKVLLKAGSGASTSFSGKIIKLN